MFENHRDSLFNDKIILKSQQVLRSDCRNVYTKEINKIVLSSTDDKRLQTFDKITKYPYVHMECKKKQKQLLKK